jgi:hypothetical protein
MRDRTLQAIVFGAWSVGVPALAAGLFYESSGLVAVGGWSLLAGVLVMTIDGIGVISHVRTTDTVKTCQSQSDNDLITDSTNRLAC